MPDARREDTTTLASLLAEYGKAIRSGVTGDTLDLARVLKRLEAWQPSIHDLNELERLPPAARSNIVVICALAALDETEGSPE